MIRHDQERQDTGAPRGQGAWWAMNLAVALLICLSPAWLWRDALLSPFLKLDDFVYLAQSRTTSSLMAHLMTPHNAHVVPLFAIQNHLLARLAGTLEAVPRVWGAACYLELVLAMIAAGLLVACETGRVALGLAAMAGVGMSTVLGPALLWYSAGQVLCSGTAILVTLLALRLWRSRGGWVFLAIVVLAALAAPLYWSAGYVAGPVALAYLLADRRVSLSVAFLPLGASILTGLFVWCLAGARIAQSASADQSAVKVITRIPAGLAHTVQAVPEVLLLNNLGLNASTSLPQAAALCLLWVLVWKVSREPEVANLTRDHSLWKWLRRPNPLEAAGATLVVTCFVMIYSARGYQSFANLRALGWYHAIPQLGAVLFAAGWVAERLQRIPSQAVQAGTARELLWVVLFAALYLILQTPRANRVLYEYDGMASKIETGEEPPMQAPRDRAQLVGRSDRQRLALARLDRLERTCRDQGIGRVRLRGVLGRHVIPGMPSNLPDLDAFDLLEVPDHGPGDSAHSIRDALREFEAQRSF